MDLSVSAIYDKNTDSVEVGFYKSSAGTPVPISSGTISLMQNAEVISSIAVDSQASFVSFFHPKTLYNLSVHADIDSLTLDAAVDSLNTLATPVEHSQQAQSIDTPMRYVPSEVSIDTSKGIISPTILDIDFNTKPVVEYAGGNRVLFDYSNKLVLQPLDTVIFAPKFSEVGAANLLPLGSDNNPDLLNLFSFNYPGSALSFKLVSPFGVQSLRASSLGGVSGNIMGSRDLVLSLVSPVVAGTTIQFFFGFLSLPTPTSFQFVTELLDSGGLVVGSDVQTLNCLDFLNGVSLLTSTPVGVGGVSLTSRIEIDGLYAQDTFDMDILLPQVTALAFASSYTPNVRTADVYSRDVILDYNLTTIEIGLVVGSNAPCVLFDCGTVSASYNGTDLIFNVNGTTISYTCSLMAFFDFSFTFDVDDNIMSIAIADVPVATGGAGFTISSNGKMFIGCDASGTNQINGQLNTFKVLR
jgi:hypothetical protein